MTFKKTLFIATILTLLPITTLAAEQQINCEQLAQHIQKKMISLDYPTVVKASDGTLNIVSREYREGDGAYRRGEVNKPLFVISPRSIELKPRSL